MKNLVAFFGLVLCLFPLLFVEDNFDFLSSYEKVVLVSDKKLNENCIQNGNEFYHSFENDDWKKWKNDSSALIFYFKKFDIENFKKKCEQFYSCTDVENYKVYQGVYAGYNNFVFVDGKKVNFQLVIKENEIVLGFPMIVVGF